MQTSTENGRSGTRNFAASTGISTQPRFNKLRRMLAFGAAALVAPPAAGLGIAALTRSRAAGWVAGGVTLVGVGLVRWQLQRWFTDEPAYTVENRIGELEIRRYAPRVEAHTRFATLDFDTVRKQGFRRLASYIFGGNRGETKIAMTTPVTITPRAATHTMAFTMPPERTLDSLPRPDDSRIELFEIPVRRFAVLSYRGAYDSKTFEQHATRILELVAHAGLTTRGEPIFAGFDPPWTLPKLRRAEVWIELA